MQIFAPAANSNGQGDQVRDPGPTLVGVEGLEAQQGEGERDQTGDDDADVYAHVIWV